MLRIKGRVFPEDSQQLRLVTHRRVMVGTCQTVRSSGTGGGSHGTPKP